MEKYFLKAIPLSDNRAFKAEMYADIAILKLVEKDNSSAFEYAKTALDTDPSSGFANLVFAKSAMFDKTTLDANLAKVRLSLFKAIFLSPKKAEAQYWQGKFEFITKNYDQAVRSYGNALKLIDGDNSLNAGNRATLRSDINLDIAVAYYLNNDKKNASVYVNEAFRYNPVKVAYILQNNEQLKELLTMLPASNK